MSALASLPWWLWYVLACGVPSTCARRLGPDTLVLCDSCVCVCVRAATQGESMISLATPSVQHTWEHFVAMLYGTVTIFFLQVGARSLASNTSRPSPDVGALAD